MKKLFKSKSAKIAIAMLMVIAMVAAFVPMALAEPDAPASDVQITNYGNNASKTDNDYPGAEVTFSKTIAGTEEENKFEITLEVTSKSIFETPVGEATYVALVLDISGSMANYMEDLKTAVEDFIEGYAESGYGSGGRYLSITTFAEDVNSKDFGNTYYINVARGESGTASANETAAINYVKGLDASGSTNTHGALLVGKYAADNFSENVASKSIILMTDGAPTAVSTTGGGGWGNPELQVIESASGYSIGTNNHRNRGLFGDGGDVAKDRRDADYAQKAANVITDTDINLYGIFFETNANIAWNALEDGGSLFGLTWPADNIADYSLDGYLGSQDRGEYATSDWLNAVVDECYTASNRDDLIEKFQQALDGITGSLAQLNTVTDVMGDYIILNSTTFSGNSVVLDADAATLKDMITWYLPTSSYTLVGDKYIYTLTYEVELDTDGITLDKFDVTESYNTNSSAVLAFQFLNKVDNKVVSYKKDEISLNSPAVQGFDADFEFIKLNEIDEIVPLAGFELSNKALSFKTSSDSADGKVSFAGIPHGEYTLKETVKADGHELTDAAVTVKVDFGVLTFANGADLVQESDLDEIFVNTREFDNDYIDVSVEKLWEGDAPEDWTVTVQLYKDDVAVADTAIVLDEVNASHTYEELPVYASIEAQDKEVAHVYTVKETHINGVALSEANEFKAPVYEVVDDENVEGNFTVQITNEKAPERTYNVVVKYFYRTGTTGSFTPAEGYDVVVGSYKDDEAYDADQATNAPSSKTFGSTAYDYHSTDGGAFVGTIDGANVIINVYYQYTYSYWGGDDGPNNPPTDNPPVEPPVDGDDDEDVTIDDGEAILAEAEPEPEPEEEEEFTEEVPLAEAPATGDAATMTIAAILALIALSGIALVIFTAKKREN